MPRAAGGALGSSNGMPAIARFSVWCEVLGTEWLGLSTALAAIGVAAFHFGWEIPGAGRGIDLQVSSLLLVLVSLLAGVLAGSQRAVARRERRVEEQRREIERLVLTPQRRVVDAKYHLYRDSFMCTQLVGFLMMARMEASAMTPETSLDIERRWGSEFLERFQRIFGSGRFGDVFSQLIGGKFPPPRDQAMSIYVGLADFLQLLAERITESDLDPEYLHGRDEPPEPPPSSAATGDAPPSVAVEASRIDFEPRSNSTRAG
jgi:hypothetical protein